MSENLRIDAFIAVDNFDNCHDTGLVNQGHASSELSKEFLIDIVQVAILESIMISIATIIHELGHATAAKFLMDGLDRLEIHIGVCAPDVDVSLFSMGNMHFYKSIPWRSGCTVRERFVDEDYTDYLNIISALVTAAGGLSTLTFLYSLLCVMAGYCTYKANKKLNDIKLKSFLNGASPFSYILDTRCLSYKQKRFLINAALVMCLLFICQIFYVCTPHHYSDDGADLLRKNFGITGTPLKLAHFAAVFGWYISVLLMLKKYCDAHKKLSLQYSKKHSPALTWTVALTSLLLMYRRLIPEF